MKPTDLTSSGLAQTSVLDPTSTSPSELSSSNASASQGQQPSNPTIGVSKRVIGGSKPTYRGGRGGAGNYSDPEAEEKAKREEDERRRVEMERAVERDVELGLARPAKAYGGQGGAWEMT